ncbi:MAG: four helix bundle protein [Bacteroidales bacterium]|nr:four helix bundle protein [Bacteroidales bacterium]MBO7528943.1 four helix bundle protein [Bacteroidales bacterium]MBQ3843795.1 four helix bundle protein [Bacteroidales bacterium]
MASYKRFEDLPIWQKARSFSKKIFEITLEDKFSKEIRLCSQIRAASGSIMDNIAEGFERNGNGEFKQFLYIAKGSCGETRSQIYRAFDYGFISEKQFEEMKSLSEEISKSINSFIDYLNNTEIKGTKFK